MKILGADDYIGADNGKVTATIGMFDGMHLGHITLINALKQEAEARHQAKQ